MMMQNHPLLGLPYVQQTANGVLLLRSGRKASMRFSIYNYGALIWTGILGLSDRFHLVFPERPGRLTYMIFVEADFGPRVSYIAFPLNCVFPTKREGTKYLLDSRDIYLSSWWGDIVTQISSATAIQVALFKRKLKPATSSTLRGLLS